MKKFLKLLLNFGPDVVWFIVLLFAVINPGNIVPVKVINLIMFVTILLIGSGVVFLLGKFVDSKINKKKNKNYECYPQEDIGAPEEQQHD
jgi:NADH:ubiquinone oxidoreductase subunit 3 (subunit A)